MILKVNLPDESLETKKLKGILAQKRLVLSRLEKRLVRLRDELISIKHEHDVRIAHLLRESDLLEYDLFEMP